MRNGGDARGSSRDRKRRKLWLLAEYGNGKRCYCVHCNKPLTLKTVEADRVIPGGSYGHHNIEPSCRHCNASRKQRRIIRVAE